MPGTAGGTVRISAFTVSSATRLTSAGGPLAPAGASDMTAFNAVERPDTRPQQCWAVHGSLLCCKASTGQHAVALRRACPLSWVKCNCMLSMFTSRGFRPCALAGRASADHVGLQQRALQQDMVVAQRLRAAAAPCSAASRRASWRPPRILRCPPSMPESPPRTCARLRSGACPSRRPMRPSWGTAQTSETRRTPSPWARSDRRSAGRPAAGARAAPCSTPPAPPR